MTQAQFEKSLKGAAKVGGMFEFFTDQNEGVVFCTKEKTFVWVDEKGFGKSPDEAEPKNIGEYKSVAEMLLEFKVDGKLFADVVLPNIKEIKQICA